MRPGILGLALLLLVLAACGEDEPAPALTYTCAPELADADGIDRMTPAITWANPSGDGFIATCEALYRRAGSQHYQAGISLEIAFDASSEGEDRSWYSLNDTEVVHLIVLLTLRQDGQVVERRWYESELPAAE